jgi:transposase, IS30 family
MNYKHLSHHERYQIYALLRAGQTQSKIASILGRHKSTISRELKLGTGLCNYRPKQACALAAKRAKSSRNASQIAPWVLTMASHMLNLQWSPVQIAGKLPISHETLYLRIYADQAHKGQLYKNLRCQKKRRKRYGAGYERRGQIIGRRSIAERPAHIESRSQIGHWEADTVIGVNHQQAIVTLVERKSGYAVIAKVQNKTAKLVSKAIVKLLEPFKAKVKTLTYDNGKEFAKHAWVDKKLSSTGYFARPYCSWQRGSNENFNGLLRQYVPKKRLMSTVTDEEITMIQNRLNHRPRKRLGFKSPHEVFHQSLNRVALRA